MDKLSRRALRAHPKGQITAEFSMFAPAPATLHIVQMLDWYFPTPLPFLPSTSFESTMRTTSTKPADSDATLSSESGSPPASPPPANNAAVVDEYDQFYDSDDDLYGDWPTMADPRASTTDR